MEPEDERIRAERWTKIQEAELNAWNNVTEEEVTAERESLLDGTLKRLLRERRLKQKIREIVVQEPDCGRPCDDKGYKQCLCHECAVLVRGFWQCSAENFTEEQKAQIIAQWDNEKGFLGENGCKLPRELRPTLCMQGLCWRIKGDDLKKYDLYNEES